MSVQEILQEAEKLSAQERRELIKGLVTSLMLSEEDVIENDFGELQEWESWIEVFVINDVKKAMASDLLEVGQIVLCFLGIDCLGGYLAGKAADADTFKQFISEFFPTEYQSHIDAMWSLRSGLVHDYVTFSSRGDAKPVFVMCRDENETHLQKRESDELISFNRTYFTRDFLEAWKRFTTKLHEDYALQAKVKARISERGYLKVEDSTEEGRTDSGASANTDVVREILFQATGMNPFVNRESDPF